VANRQRFLLLKPNTKRVASTQLRLIAFGIERCDLKRRGGSWDEKSKAAFIRRPSRSRVPAKGIN